MDVKQLITFKTLSQEQNYIKASEKLNYAPSTLAKHIHGLEDELGCTLVEYRNGKIELTYNGEKLMKYAENILLEYMKIQAVFSPEITHRQNLRVVGGEFMVGFNFVDLFAKLSKVDIDFSLSAFTTCCAHATEWLAQDRADVAFVEAMSLDDVPGYITVPLFKEKLCLMASPDHHLANVANISTSQLADCDFAFTYDDCCFTQKFEKMLYHYTDRPELGMYLGSVNSVVHAAKTDNRICLVPYSVTADIADMGLVTLDWIDSFDIYSVILIREDGNSPAVQRLVEEAQEYTKKFKANQDKGQIVIL